LQAGYAKTPHVMLPEAAHSNLQYTQAFRKKNKAMKQKKGMRKA